MTATHVTLGILAGGRATRLGGRDKAWLRRDGVPQVLRLARRLEGQVESVIVSANASIERYRDSGFDVVADPAAGQGPIAGLDALMRACRTPWLLTVPVDVIDVNDCLLPTLMAHAGGSGAMAVDEDGIQPLVALWKVSACRAGIEHAIAGGDFSIQHLQSRLGFASARFSGLRFGNLNTMADLAAVGVDAGP